MVVVCVCPGLMFSTTLATLVIPPPDPVMARVNVPVGELLGMLRVSVVENVGVDDGIVKTGLTPGGSPLTLRET